MLLAELDSRQLSEWMAYYSIEPWGEQPAYLRAGVVASTMANVMRGKKGRSFTPDEFMPKEPKRPAPKVQTVSEQKSAIMSMVAWAKRTGKMKKKD